MFCEYLQLLFRFKIRRCFSLPLACAPVQLVEGEFLFGFSVVDDDEGFREADGTGPSVPGCAGNGFGGDVSDAVLEQLVIQAVSVGDDYLGNTSEHAGGKGQLLTFPGAQGQAECPVQYFVSEFVIDVFQRADRTNGPGFVVIRYRL